MSEAALREARRALARLRRSVEKASRDLAAVESALRDAEGPSFRAAPYTDAAARLDALGALVGEESDRLQSMILETGLTGPARRAPPR